MARRRRKKKKRSLSQNVTLMLAGSAMTLCLLSIVYGVLIRKSMAGGPPAEPVRIEIWNGTGEAGLASRVATAVRRRGIDVFDYGNAPNFEYGETMLVGRRPNDQLQALGDMLGCENVIEQFQEGTPVDATLIIGADYERLNLDLEADSTLPR